MLDQSFGGAAGLTPAPEPGVFPLEYGLTNEPGVACGILTLPPGTSCSTMSLSFSPVRRTLLHPTGSSPRSHQAIVGIGDRTDQVLRQSMITAIRRSAVWWTALWVVRALAMLLRNLTSSLDIHAGGL